MGNAFGMGTDGRVSDPYIKSWSDSASVEVNGFGTGLPFHGKSAGGETLISDKCSVYCRHNVMRCMLNSSLYIWGKEQTSNHTGANGEERAHDLMAASRGVVDTTQLPKKESDEMTTGMLFLL